MNKKIFKAALLVAVVAVAGLGAYKAQAKKNTLSDIMLANVESIAGCEIYDSTGKLIRRCVGDTKVCWELGNIICNGTEVKE